jgi:hypothetical protein
MRQRRHTIERHAARRKQLCCGKINSAFSDQEQRRRRQAARQTVMILMRMGNYHTEQRGIGCVEITDRVQRLVRPPSRVQRALETARTLGDVDGELRSPRKSAAGASIACGRGFLELPKQIYLQVKVPHDSASTARQVRGLAGWRGATPRCQLL